MDDRIRRLHSGAQTIHPESVVKNIALALLTSALLSTAPAAFAQRTPVPVTAVEVSIGGIGPGVDATAFRKVRLLISDAMFKGTIDYFDVYGYGKEGGFSACMEKGRFAAAGSFELFLKALKAIRPNPATTAYSVDGVTLCSYPTATLP
jgi:hypothetical protein